MKKYIFQYYMSNCDVDDSFGLTEDVVLANNADEAFKKFAEEHTNSEVVSAQLVDHE